MGRISVFDLIEGREKTFSQKVARFFEVMNFIALIPITLSLGVILFFSVFYTLAFLASGWILIYFTIELIILLIPYSLMCLLLRGYFLHSRGRLSEEKVKWLWIGTIIFNIIPLGFMVLMIRETMPFFDFFSLDFWGDLGNRIAAFILAWFIAVCALSVVSLFDDYAVKNNNRNQFHGSR